eukprot:728035-Pyramimonas_sp.AAC.1
MPPGGHTRPHEAPGRPRRCQGAPGAPGTCAETRSYESDSFTLQLVRSYRRLGGDIAHQEIGFGF